MKTFFAIALNCVYLTLAVGVAKTTHYCMGRANHTAHFSFKADPCACFRVMGEASDCCDSESVLLQVDDAQTASAKLIVAPAALPLICEFEFLVVDLSTQAFQKEFTPEKFPRPPSLKAFISYCSLVI